MYKIRSKTVVCIYTDTTGARISPQIIRKCYFSDWGTEISGGGFVSLFLSNIMPRGVHCNHCNIYYQCWLSLCHT